MSASVSPFVHFLCFPSVTNVIIYSAFLSHGYVCTDQAHLVTFLFIILHRSSSRSHLIFDCQDVVCQYSHTTYGTLVAVNLCSCVYI